MKPCIFRAPVFFIAAAILLAAGIQPAFGSGGPGNLLVLVNDASQDSLDAANYYRHARKIPEICFCHLNLKPVHELDKAEFEAKILKPMLEYIKANGLEGVVKYVVFTIGLPYRVKWIENIHTSVTTVASAAAMEIGVMRSQPYYGSEKPFEGFPSMPYLSIALTGYSVADVKRCIDQGVASDGTFPKGTVYLFDGVGPRARVHEVFDRQRTHDELNKAGIKAVLRPEHSLTNEKDVLGYWTGAVRVNTKDIGFLPGALADHLTSFGGILFDNKSQMSILDFIQAGATGSYGTVTEPTNIPTRHSKAFVFLRYLSGLSLIESYWSSVEDVQLGVFVGEPLASPFLRKVRVEVKGPDPKKPVSGEVKFRITAKPAADDAKIRRLEWWLNGRPFGPAIRPSLPPTAAVLALAGREFRADYAGDTGAEGVASKLAGAVNADPELSKPEGVSAEARGPVIVLKARSEGSGGNSMEFKAEIHAEGDGASPGPVPSRLASMPPSGRLAGGRDTERISALLRFDVSGKALKAGDSISISSLGTECSDSVTDADVSSGKPLVAMLVRLLKKIEDSGVMRKPQAGALNQEQTAVQVVLIALKEAEEGNGQEVMIGFKKAQGSDLNLSVSGKAALAGGATRRYFASAKVEFMLLFDPPDGTEIGFDTSLIPDGWNRLRLVAGDSSPMAAEGFAFADVLVANTKAKLKLEAPSKPDLSKPMAFNARFYGDYPAGAKRILFLADGRILGEFDSKKRFVLDPAKLPLGSGKHEFAAMVEPRKEGSPPVRSDPLVIEKKA